MYSNISYVTNLEHVDYLSPTFLGGFAWFACKVYLAISEGGSVIHGLEKLIDTVSDVVWDALPGTYVDLAQKTFAALITSNGEPLQVVDFDNPVTKELTYEPL